MQSDIVQRLLFHGRFASENQQQCAARKNAEREEASAEIARLTEALRKAADRGKALRDDADRYRWIRDHSCPPHNFYISVPDEFADIRYAPDEVDAYIDAARAALKEQPHD